MGIREVEEALRQNGALQVHIDHFWRQWILRKAPTARTPRLPLSVQETAHKYKDELNKLAEVVEECSSSSDGTRLVLKLHDGQLIESVILPRGGVCVSTQVGCAVGCVFCMTGKSGLIRQLSDLEILAQVEIARRYQQIKKVVFMGMGEPSHNLKRVLSSINFLAKYSGISYKNLVLSTVGDRRLFDAIMASKVKPALALSLHSTFDEKRKQLMPNIQPMPVADMMAFAAEYAKAGGYPVQFQWTLIDGVNDGDEEVENVISLWKGQKAILNMIPVNKIAGSPYERPSEEAMLSIAERLKKGHVLLKYRHSAAQEVEGGCGQLRARKIEELPE